MSAFTLLASKYSVSAFSQASRTPFLKQASRSISRSSLNYAAKEGQAEVVLVGCGAPNRGMGWYHAIQMIENK